MPHSELSLRFFEEHPDAFTAARLWQASLEAYPLQSFSNSDDYLEPGIAFATFNTTNIRSIEIDK